MTSRERAIFPGPPGDLVDRKKRESPHEIAFAKAKKAIAEGRISEDDFVDLYGDMVARDQATVEKLQNKFSQDKNKIDRAHRERAIILEAIIDEQIELAQWFGENATTIKTSLFDDYMNGIDTLVEFTPEDGANARHLALATDITYAHRLNKKFKRIREEIYAGQLARVKYFQSDSSDFRGELRNLPRIVISVTNEQVDELRDLWTATDAKQRREIDTHPVRKQIIAQVALQLLKYEDYARSMYKGDIAKRYRAIYTQLKPVIVEQLGEDFDQYIQSNPAVQDFKEKLDSNFI